MNANQLDAVIANLRGINADMRHMKSAADRLFAPSIIDIEDFLATADIGQIGRIAEAMAARLASLSIEHDYSGNLDEAADFARGIALDMKGAAVEIAEHEEKAKHPPRCKCDGCMAAASDEAFDRKRDEALTN